MRKLLRSLVQPLANSWDEVIEHKLTFKLLNSFLVLQLAGTKGRPKVVLGMTFV